MKLGHARSRRVARPFVARLLVARLLVRTVETELAVAGSMRVVSESVVVDGVRPVRSVFEGDAPRVLRHVIREIDAIVWPLARGR